MIRRNLWKNYGKLFQRPALVMISIISLSKLKLSATDLRENKLTAPRILCAFQE